MATKGHLKNILFPQEFGECEDLQRLVLHLVDILQADSSNLCISNLLHRPTGKPSVFPHQNFSEAFRSSWGGIWASVFQKILALALVFNIKTCLIWVSNILFRYVYKGHQWAKLTRKVGIVLKTNSSSQLLNSSIQWSKMNTFLNVTFGANIYLKCTFAGGYSLQYQYFPAIFYVFHSPYNLKALFLYC